MSRDIVPGGPPVLVLGVVFWPIALIGVDGVFAEYFAV
jgi:hypothetical protein